MPSDMTRGDGFAARVYAVMAEVPAGRVVTYGDVAAWCGSPRAARIVGGLAHFGAPDLPWHRLVRQNGTLAAGFPGGRIEQARRLADEGVITDDNFKVDISTLLWDPQHYPG